MSQSHGGVEEREPSRIRLSSLLDRVMRPAGAGELARVTAEGLPPFTIHAYITTVPATHCHHSLHSTVVISSAVYHSRTDPKPVQSAGPEFESGFCVLLLVCTMKQPSHRRADCSDLTPLRASGVALVSASRQLATFRLEGICIAISPLFLWC